MPRNASTAGRNAPSQDELIAFYDMMQLIRQAELRLGVLFTDGEIPGFIHLSVGQEAVPAGIMSALTPDDTVASNHRGHGHAIARGVDLGRLVLEIMAKEEGYCRGRGGSMHVADAAIGMLGANGIVGAGLPIAVGSAVALQVRKSGGIAVVFFGDGGLAEGVLHESLNLAALWKLPLLFVCENNGWSEFSATSRQFVADLQKLAPAYGVPFVRVDGNDVLAVAQAAREATAQIRAGQGPYFIECKTIRIRGHYEGDQQKYRPPAEMARLEDNDPIARLESELQAAGVSAAVLSDRRSRVAARVEAAVAAGRAGRDPVFADAFRDVYTAAGVH